MENLKYDVPSINCGHCVATIERVVGELAGVQEVVGDVETKKVAIAYGPPATPEQIVAAMTEWDHPPVIA